MRVALPDGAELWTAVEGCGPPVVLCHGGPGLWDYLDELATLLADEFTVYRWDQRACGRSTAGSLRPSMQQTIDDLDELRSHFGHERWSVLGHSWGAEIGLFYGLLHRSSLDRLAYVSGRGTQAWWRASGRAEWQASTRSRMTNEQAARLATLDNLAARGPDEESEFRFLSWMTDFCEPESNAALQSMVHAPFAVNYEVNHRLSRDEPLAGDALRAACERFDAPILFMHGEHDPRPAEGARILTSWTPASSIHIIPDAAHLPWVEQPAPVVELLKTFLRPTGPMRSHR